MPSGTAGSNPALPTICRSPSVGGGAVWKTVGRRKTGLQVRVLSAALSYLETCANWQAACPEHRWSKRVWGFKVSAPLRSAQSRRPPGRRAVSVPLRSSLNGSSPGRAATPVFAYKPLWQNWQMHLPAKQGPVDPASGVGTRERRSSREQLVFLDFSKNL